MKVIPISAFESNYIWLIREEESNYCAIVDPGDVSPVINYLEKHNLVPTAVLITHHHSDHTGGVQSLKDNYTLNVYGPAHPRISPLLTNTIDEDSGEITIPKTSLAFRPIHTPGHTLTHHCYYGHGSLFVGDTLFSAGCGRMFEGTPHQFYHSLSRLADFADDTKIYPAHEYTLDNLRFAKAVEPCNRSIDDRIAECEKLRSQELPTLPSTIGLEKKVNPFLRCKQNSVKQAAMDYSENKIKDNIDIFAAIRKWKDKF